VVVQGFREFLGSTREAIALWLIFVTVLLVPFTVLGGLDAYLMYMTPLEIFQSASLLLVMAVGCVAVVAALPSVLLGAVALSRLCRADIAARVLMGFHIAALMAVSLYWLSRVSKRWFEAVLGFRYIVPWEAKYGVLAALFVAAVGAGWALRKVPLLEKTRAWVMTFFPVAIVVALVGIAGVLSSDISVFEYEQLKGGPRVGGGDSRPNVILITADALTAEDMSLYGYPIDTTPHLDRFAKSSYVFDNFFADSNSTTPAINSLLTGKHVDSHGAYQIWSRALPGTERENVAQILRDSGYLTAAFVANPAAHPLSGRFSESFDYLSAPPNRGVIGAVHRQLLRLKGVTVFPLVEDLLAFVPQPLLELLEPQTTNPYPAEALTEQALRFLDLYRKGAPIFAWIHIYPPHAPYLPPNPFMYSMLPDRVLDRASPQVVLAGGDLRTRESDIEALRLRYNENIRYADSEIGRFLNLIKARGYWDDSLIIFTADHGESFARRWVFHGGPHLTQPLVHIPLLVHFPKQTVGRRISALGQQSDLAPTVLEALSLDRAAWVEGESLLSEMEGVRNVETRPKFSMTLERTSRFVGPTRGTYAVMKGRFKYVRYLDGKRDVELYDLPNDPHEVHNLAGLRPDMANSMDALLQARLQAHQR